MQPPTTDTQQPDTAELIALLHRLLNDEREFVRATFSGQRRGADMRWQRLVIRPVMLRGERHLQFSYFDARQNFTHNHTGSAIATAIDEALALPFQNYTLTTTREVIQARISKKGKPLISRSKATAQAANPDLSHDRQRQPRIEIDEASLPYLVKVGIATQDGRIRADMRHKYTQINRFIELADAGEVFKPYEGKSVRIMDAGCGSAYLTFGLYHYLTHVKKIKTTLIGIDHRDDLIQENNGIARELGWDMEFVTSSIINYSTDTPPDIVIALHACDTATDEAMMQGIVWGAKAIICAPCCQHDLQAQIDRARTPSVMLPVMRHGTLRWQMGDLLTDAFRALLLRVMGYRTDVLEFVSAEHTPKNIMVRAVLATDPYDTKFVDEYRTLREFWDVTPHLDTLLSARHKTFSKRIR